MKLPDPNTIRNALEQIAQYGTPPTGTASVFDVGSDKFRQYFERELLDDFVVHGGATCKLIEGPYGSGKTHLLDLLHESGLRRGMAVLRADLSQALNLENWQLITQYFLENLQIEIDGHIHRSLPAILEVLGRQDGFDARRLWRATLPHPGFGAAMENATRQELRTSTREALDTFLRGQRISVADLHGYGVSRNVRGCLSKRNAESVMKTVLSGLALVGVPGVLLLFDENEATFTFRGSKAPIRVQLGANLLRRLIDACASGGVINAIFVMAVLPGFVEHCALAYPALGQRLSIPADSEHVGWRWPWIRVEQVAPDVDPEAFVRSASRRFEELVRQCGAAPNGLNGRLVSAGIKVLEGHAGVGYRRLLIKSLATLALEHLGGIRP